MPIPGLDPARCARRNRFAALKGFDAIPVRLLASVPPPIDTTDPDVEKSLRTVTARGTLPATKEAAVARINALRLNGKEKPLTEDQVHLVYLEAGNSNYIKKYNMHLGDSTLRNIAERANGRRSIAFMNNHKTGAELSQPSEQPYGRTFAGRFEQAIAEDGRSFSRTLLGIYMIAGIQPNGASGPSTDDLFEGIDGGTIFDVSLGVDGGDAVCDVCGEQLETFDEEGEPLCPHIPGTHYSMSTDEIKGQKARGVPNGVATYTLEHATASEVSSVHDGAVPGAGFRKALSIGRSFQLSEDDLGEIVSAYGPLVGQGDFQHQPAWPVLFEGDSPMFPRRRASLAGQPAQQFSVEDLNAAWEQMGRPQNIDVNQLAAFLQGQAGHQYGQAPALPFQAANPAQFGYQPQGPGYGQPNPQQFAQPQQGPFGQAQQFGYHPVPGPIGNPIPWQLMPGEPGRFGYVQAAPPQPQQFGGGQPGHAGHFVQPLPNAPAGWNPGQAPQVPGPAQQFSGQGYGPAQYGPPAPTQPGFPLTQVPPGGTGDPNQDALLQHVHLLTQTIETERHARLQESESQRRSAITAHAEKFADDLIARDLAMPKDRTNLIVEFGQAAMDDHCSPVQLTYVDAQGVPKLGTRLDVVKAKYASNIPHGFGGQRISSVPPQNQFGSGQPGQQFGYGPTSGHNDHLTNLSTLPAQDSRDPIGDTMEQEAYRFAQRRNGPAGPAAGPTGNPMFAAGAGWPNGIPMNGFGAAR